jgi:hypothetical protein
LIEEAYAEYWRRIDEFTATDAGMHMWKDYYGLRTRATGLSTAEYEQLDAAHWAYQNSLIDYEALERESRVWLRKTLAGSQICGWCGGSFESIEALMSHQGFCSFRRDGGLMISDVISPR